METDNVGFPSCSAHVDNSAMEVDHSRFSIPASSAPDELWYDMPNYENGGKRGLCVIFNITTFSEHPDKKRKGSDEDEKRIKQVFGDSLHFDTKVYRDPPSQRMLRILQRLSQNGFSNSDCFACFVLSHGDNGIIYCSDSETITVEDMCNYFTSANCRALQGKPKLFFIQSINHGEVRNADETVSNARTPEACRGGEEDEVRYQSDFLGDSDTPFRRKIVPTDADFYLFYATTPGRVSYRHQCDGTVFTQFLCEVLQRDYADRDFDSMMTLVKEYVADHDIGNAEKRIVKQMPSTTSTLTKRLYFTPKTERKRFRDTDDSAHMVPVVQPGDLAKTDVGSQQHTSMGGVAGPKGSQPNIEIPDYAKSLLVGHMGPLVPVYKGIINYTRGKINEIKEKEHQTDQTAPQKRGIDRTAIAEATFEVLGFPLPTNSKQKKDDK